MIHYDAKAPIGMILRGRRGLTAAIAIGILISFTLRATAPLGVKITNPQLVSDAQRDAAAPRVRSASANLSVVIFTDYRCAACRRSDTDLLDAVREDGRIVIIFRHRPAFGIRSVVAARLAIAAQWQGKFLPVHAAFMKAPGNLDETELMQASTKAGAVWSRLQIDLRRHSAQIDRLLARNAGSMSRLGLRGTPSYLIGNCLVEEALTRQQLRKLFRDARASRS